LVTTPPVEQDATVAVALPPDLEWLNTAGPYTATVASIVGQVRISRTAIALSLEKLNARRASLAADLGTLDAQIAREQATLMHVEETLGSCQLLVENSAKIGSEWLKPSTVKHNGHRATGDIYGSRDLRKFFEANPSTNWTAAEIVATAPLAKRATAKVNVPAGLAALAKEGFLIRIDKGVYRKGSQ
jgi:hypothetical protein